MYPVLVEIGPFKLYSFGLMVVLAFLTGGALASRELARRKIEPPHLEGYPLLALVGGVLGARLYYIVAHFDRVLASPFEMLVTGSGMTWYGGALGGALAVLGWAKRKQQDLWAVCDAAAPALAAAYAIGRIGCHLSGDGDYGPPTDLPWGVSYASGTVPTPPGVMVHPTPVYEALAMGFVAALLWQLRTKLTPSGRLFGLYLCLVGLERWTMEWWRLNPPVALDLSVAQWSSFGAIAVGLFIFVKRSQA